jgi:hypothetical protein
LQSGQPPLLNHMPRIDFINQLQELGYKVEDKGTDFVAFPYEVPIGKFRGQQIMLAFQVNDGFPLNPPGGPHISPRLLFANRDTTTNIHPKGAIHESPALGKDWEYWSRPFPGWSETNRDVKDYLAHIRHLFDTQ